MSRRWLLTLHGVDDEGQKHSVKQVVPFAVTKDFYDAWVQQGFLPDAVMAQEYTAQVFDAWMDGADKHGFFNKDGKKCRIIAVDSVVEDI